MIVDVYDCGRCGAPLVCRRVTHVLPLQEHVNFAEARPLRRITVPAFDHQIVNFARTVGRLVQMNDGGGESPRRVVLLVATAAVFDDLRVGQSRKRPIDGECQNFPQGDGKRPDIRLARIPVL